MPEGTNRFYARAKLAGATDEQKLSRMEWIIRDLMDQLNRVKVPIVVLPGNALPSGMQYGQPVIDVRTGTPILQIWNGTTLVNAGESVSTFPDLNDTPANYTGAAGKVVAVNAGETALEFVTASSVNEFTDLDDTPSSLSGQGLKAVRVNSGETALEFASPTFLALTDTPSSLSGESLKLVRVNTGETALEFVSPSAGGVTDFPDLGDTPANYTGAAGKYVKVNSTPDGLEFTNSTFLDGSDTPSSYSGQGSKLVAVNSGATALEFVAVSSLSVGKVLQVSEVNSGTHASGTTTIPFDDTSPQNTEGTELFTLSFTPVSSTSTLYFEFSCPYCFNSAAANIMLFALFVDSTADALAVGGSQDQSASNGQNVHFMHKVASASTSARTYKIRFGPHSSGTMYVNGNSTAKMNGLFKTTLRITEVEA